MKHVILENLLNIDFNVISSELKDFDQYTTLNLSHDFKSNQLTYFSIESNNKIVYESGEPKLHYHYSSWYHLRSDLHQNISN